MGYHLNRLDEPVFMAGPKAMRTEFGIHHSCVKSCVKQRNVVPRIYGTIDAVEPCVIV